MGIIPLDRLFKREAFEKGVIRKVSDFMYEVNAGISLADSANLALRGWITVIVTDKFITLAEVFFPPEYFEIKEGRAKVIKLYLVRSDKSCEVIDALSKQFNVRKGGTVEWWCSEL